MCGCGQIRQNTTQPPLLQRPVRTSHQRGHEHREGTKVGTAAGRRGEECPSLLQTVLAHSSRRSWQARPGARIRPSGLRAASPLRNGNVLNPPPPLPLEHLPAWGLRDDRTPGTDQAVRGGRHGQKVHSGFPPPGREMPAAVRMPAVVRMPACHSRRVKGERPIGAATG